MEQATAQFQIGKSGLTQGVINSLNLALRTHRQIRVSVLKSVNRDGDKMKVLSEEILRRLNWKSASRIIGFTIILTKLSRKPKKA